MAKPALSIADQIGLLVQRGLPVALPSDPEWEERRSEYHALARLLIDNNYYRLSGYWRYFQVNPARGDNRFTAAATVAQIEMVYTFDHDLRSLLLEGLSVFEVTFRSRFAYYVAVNLSHDCYLDRTFFIDERGKGRIGLRDALITDIRQELARSKERFVAHHQTKGQTVPVWAAVEVLSFGTVSKMYRLLGDQTVRTSVSKSFGLPNPRFAAPLCQP